MGETLHSLLGRIGSELWFPWQHIAHKSYNGVNSVATFSRLFFIRSFSYLQVTITCMRAWRSWKFGLIQPQTGELAALVVLEKIPIDLQWEKRCCHFFSAVFDRILFILACKDDIHESLDEFEIWPDPTPDHRVTCP